MAQSKSSLPMWLFVTLAHAPVLLGYFFLAWGYALVAIITVIEPRVQEEGVDLAASLLYLAGMVFFPLLFVVATIMIWKSIPNSFLRGASLYVSLLILAGVILFFLMIGIGGVSMASVDNPNLDLTTPALNEAVKWLLFGQVFIIPWSIGATALLNRKFPK